MSTSISSWREIWPEGAKSSDWQHSGIAITRRGLIAFAAPWGRDLVIVDDSRGSSRLVPTPLVELHGISRDDDDTGAQGALWVADPGVKARPEAGYAETAVGGRAGRLSLDDGVFTEIALPTHPAYATAGWRPTSVVGHRDVTTGTSRVWVADGYGASLVHLYSGDGGYRLTLDAAETGQPLSSPHGLLVDDRTTTPTLLVADRRNRRLVRFSLEGAVEGVIESAQLRSPSSLARRGREILVTELDGALLAVDEADEVREVIPRSPRPEKPDGWPSRDGWPNSRVRGELRRPRLVEGELNSPHGLAVGDDGAVYLTEWLIGGRQIRIDFND